MVPVDFNPTSTVSNITGDWYLARYNKCTYAPTPSSMTSPTICAGSAATLTVAVGSYTTGWYTAVGSTTTFATGSSIISPTISGNTTFYASNTNRCGTSGRVPITIIADNQFLSASLSASTICQGQRVIVTASGGQTYNFGSGSTSINTYTTPIYGLSGTWFTSFTGTNTSGCSQTYTYSILVNPTPTISFGTSTLSGAFCNNTVNTGTLLQQVQQAPTLGCLEM
ncbi:MAG: hypothetical protein IPJ32_13660 [Sphingobacteriaceae bacterium]|nr:hypothetical protein [Sphingobacteriaceae bacterium]